MVQVLPANRRPSFTEGLLGGLTQAAPDAIQQLLARRDQMQQAQAQQQAMEQENNALSQQFGVNLQGIQNPKIRELAVKNSEKQRALSSLLGGQGNAPEIDINATQGAPQAQQEPEMNAPRARRRYSPEELARLAAYEPQLAAQLQRSQDAEQRAREHEENKDLAERRFQSAEKKESSREKTESFKINQQFLDKVYTDTDAANQRLAQIERMEQLNDSGELSSSNLINAMEIIGLPIELLGNMSNDEYQKLSLDLTSGITGDYGSRILATEFNTFLKRIPTLRNSPEGRKQIISNMKMLAEIPRLKKDALSNILDEHDATNKPLPLNLRGAVDKRVKPLIDQVYKDFKERNGRVKVPKGTDTTPQIVDKYLALAYDPDTKEYDVEKAMKMASEDGYNIGK